MENCKRKLQITDWETEVDLNNPVSRYPGNPIITCADVNCVWKDPRYQVITVHNAGITFYNDEVIMLFRSHLRNGISVIGTARSRNGINNWAIDSEPSIKPCNDKDVFAEGTNKNNLIENEAGGVEDPRISCVGDTYFITYSAYHALEKDKVRVSLITTQDFKSFVRHGPLMDVDMRNVVIFPEKINDRYYALFRPNDHTEDHTGGVFKEIQIGCNKDIFNNNWILTKEPIMRQAGGPSTFGSKIGPGATPIKTKYGWINIFHGVRGTMDGNPYTLGVALHDLKNPEKVQVSNIPILFPAKADCRTKDEEYVHVPNVVFCCGAHRKDDGTIFIYYGGNDTVMNVGVTHEDVLVELCLKYPQNPMNGIPAYPF